MTQFHSLTVALDKDYKEEDIQPLIDAIGMMKGVVSVDGNVSDAMVYVATTRAKQDMIDKIFKILYDKP